MHRIPTALLMHTAYQKQTVLPAFNIPYLPMMKPVADALRDCKTMGLITVARLEWIKFGSKSPAAIHEEYLRCADNGFTRLHLDHVPVIDEDNIPVEYEPVIQDAVNVGFESVMIDGSRLNLDDNITATRQVVEIAHRSGRPVEAELGAVMGHESGPMPPYEDLFASGNGFTDPSDASRFVKETGIAWLSVAIGNVHGAISAAARGKQKVCARLNIDHLKKINECTRIPLVLHGGTGIEQEYILESIKHGIAKINIATAIRQPYEEGIKVSEKQAQEMVYRTSIDILTRELKIENNISLYNA